MSLRPVLAFYPDTPRRLSTPLLTPLNPTPTHRQGSLACSTCHVIIEDEKVYDALPEPDDDENDMLDLAFGLTETSRLGCQVIAAKEIDGLRLSLPRATRNFAVDGFVPKPH